MSNRIDGLQYANRSHHLRNLTQKGRRAGDVRLANETRRTTGSEPVR